MPYLSAPLLKGFVEKNDPDITVKCIDLNLNFFKSAVEDYDELMDGFRTALDSSSVVRAVGASIYWQNRVISKIEDFSSKHVGHSWSHRNYVSKHDRNVFSDCISYSNLTSPFDDCYFDFFNQNSTPDFFSISLTVEDQVLPVFRLLRLTRKQWPGVPIILGGNLINRIGRFMDVIELKKICDFVILREGELPFLKVLQSIKGLNTNIEKDPKIINLQDSNIPKLGDLDSLHNELHTNLNFDFQPDFSDLDINSYLAPAPILPVLMSRKCYWGRCQFCNIHSAWDPSHRRRSSTEIFEELVQKSKIHGTKFFRVVDEGCPPDLLVDVSELILQNSLDLRFEIYGILEKRFLKEELVRKISDAGCRQIFFGLESIDPKTIKSMSKEINRTHDVEKIFKLTSSNGIHNYAFSMYGFPGQDSFAQNKTIDYIIGEKNIHTAVVSNYIAELEAPYTKENQAEFIHDGNMTERFWQRNIGGQKIKCMNSGKQDARVALHEIYTRRQDLAITSLLYDETRLVLCDKFGPDFAQQYLSVEKNLNLDINKIVRSEIEQRIERQLIS